MRIANDDLITSPEDMSLSFILPAIWLGHTQNYTIQLVFTGTPQGYFKLQTSEDEGRPAVGSPEQDSGVVTWSDIPASVQSVTEAGDHTWEDKEIGYRWVRIVWIADGIGTDPLLVSARFSTKAVT